MKFQLTYICLTALALAACGGGSSGNGTDDEPQGDGDGDGDGDTSGDGDAVGDGDTAGDGDAAGDGDSSANLEVIVEVTSDVPGFATTATVETEAGATLQWKLSKVPPGSGLSTADLEGTDSTEVSFIPDLSGTYQITVTAVGEFDTTTKHVEFVVKGFDIPFTVLHVVPAGDPETVHLAKVVDSGALPARDIGCEHQATSAVAGANDVYSRRAMTAVRMPKQADDPAVIVSRIFSAGENNQLVEAATSTTNCQDAPPQELDVGEAVAYVSVPFRISPNGQRFVGVGYFEDTYVMYTWGVDGTENNLMPATNPEVVSHQAWYDDETLAYTEGVYDGENYVYSMYLVPDMDAATAEDATLIIDCESTPAADRILPSPQFMFRGTTLFLASSLGIFRMEATEGIYDCDINADTNTHISNVYTPGHFDVSDDGSLVAFQNEEGTEIYTVPPDGTTTPLQLSPSDGAAHHFPQFALGGRQIVWSSSYIFDEGDAEPLSDGKLTRIHRANANGSHHLVVWSSEVPIEETVEATTGDQRGGLCTFGIPLPGGPAGFAALGLGLAAALRRRRPRTSS